MSLSNHQTIQWMRKRFSDRASPKYRSTSKELRKHEELENLFRKFDDDNSGTLDVNEIYQMFIRHGINVSKDKLRELFSEVNPKKKGELTLEEFKDFSLNPSAIKGIETAD